MDRISQTCAAAAYSRLFGDIRDLVFAADLPRMGARGGRGGAPAPARSADADTGRVALVLPDRLAADPPPPPLRARARPMRGVRPAARHAGGPARRRPLVRRGRADLA